MKCGDQAYEKQIDQKVEAMVETLGELPERTENVTLIFHSQNMGGGVNQGFFGQGGRKEIWEQWNVSFKFKEVLRRDQEAESMEDTLRDVILDIVQKVNSKRDGMPPLYEQLKCFPFEIELQKTQQQSKGSSWILGGLFRKLTQ